MLVNEKYTLDTLISNEKYVYLKCPEWNFRVLPVNEDYSLTYDALNELLVGEEGHGGQHVPILLVLLLPEGQPPAPHHQATRPRLGWTRTKDYNNNNDNDSIMVGIRLIIQKDNAILRLAKHKELVLRTGTQGQMDGLANKKIWHFFTWQMNHRWPWCWSTWRCAASCAENWRLINLKPTCWTL